MVTSRGRILSFATALLLSTGCASMISGGKGVGEEAAPVMPDHLTANPPSKAIPLPLGFAGSNSDRDQTRTGLVSTDSRSLSSSGPFGSLGLEEAKSLAIRLNPQVAQDREAIAKAAGGEEVAFSGYLPTVLGSYSYQAFSSNVGFAGTHDRFPVLPVRGFGPGTQDFSVTEAQLRWNVFQFGRQIAKHGQSVLKVEIARLQYQRSVQAAEFDVSLAYFRVLESRAALINAEQSVIRAEAILKDAGDLLKQGVITPEEVLRAEVETAEVRQLLTTARSTAEISVAGLNRSIGLGVNDPTEVVERREEPAVDLGLEDCLKLAVARRPEIAVVRKGVAIAGAEIKIASSQFLPTFSIQSSLSNVTGTGDPERQRPGRRSIRDARTLHRRQAPGSVAGSRRRRPAPRSRRPRRSATGSPTRRTWPTGGSRMLGNGSSNPARPSPRPARTSGSLSNRLKTGDAIPSELIAAQTSLTRTEQSYNSAFYDYQIAIARLEFAVGDRIARPGAEVAPPEGPGQVISNPPAFRPLAVQARGVDAIAFDPPADGVGPAPLAVRRRWPVRAVETGRARALPRFRARPRRPLRPTPSGLARPPYESNPLAPARPPGSGP